MEPLPPGSRASPSRGIQQHRALQPRTERATDVVAEGPTGNGLVKKAPAIDPVVPLPAGVRCVRQATTSDADAIAAIQDHYELRKIDASDPPQNGWLVQSSTPDAIRFAMGHYKDFWVAENDDGKVIAFQAVSAARFISRPAGKHKFLGPYAQRAHRLIESGRFIYMSQIATDPEFRGKGLAASLQAAVLVRYRKYPLVAHVAVFTQQDFDARPTDGSPFEPRFNNVASHKFHQRHGYRLVGYTSDLANTRAYNTGLMPAERSDGDLPGIVGALYVNFRDGAEALPREYVDPVEAVLGAPCLPGHGEEADWANAFPEHWPDPDDSDVGARAEAKHLTELIRLWDPPHQLPY